MQGVYYTLYQPWALRGNYLISQFTFENIVFAHIRDGCTSGRTTSRGTRSVGSSCPTACSSTTVLKPRCRTHAGRGSPRHMSYAIKAKMSIVLLSVVTKNQKYFLQGNNIAAGRQHSHRGQLQLYRFQRRRYSNFPPQSFIRYVQDGSGICDLILTGCRHEPHLQLALGT